MEEKKTNIKRKKIPWKQPVTFANRKKSTPILPGNSPLTGLGCIYKYGRAHFPRENVLWLTISGAHLGRFPVKTPQFAPSPLVCSSLSGKRDAFSIINQQKITTQLVRTFYIIALLLKKGGRVLLINESDVSTNMTRHVFPGARQEHCLGQEFQEVVSGERLILSQGLWKAGTCSNWLEICKKFWNGSHCQQFLALSPTGRGEKPLERRKQYFQQATSFSNPAKRGSSQNFQEKYPSEKQRVFSKKKSITLNSLLYYSKKPDLICVLTKGRTASLVGEARALKVPLLYLSDTDFNHIHCNFAPSVTSTGGINRTVRQQYMFTNGAYPWIGNGDSLSFSFLVSSLLAQLVSCDKKREKA